MESKHVLTKKLRFCTILFVFVSVLLVSIGFFDSATTAYASRSNLGTNTDGEWTGTQTTPNLITIGAGNLEEQGWQNINDQIRATAVWYKDADLKTEEYGWGIQAKNSSDDIGNGDYNNGVWYRITLSDADRVKANKGDLLASASSLNYEQDIWNHYCSVKLFFDDAEGKEISHVQQAKKIDGSAYKLSITEAKVPVGTASIRYYVSNWGGGTARPFIGGLTCWLTDTTAPSFESATLDKSGVINPTENITIAGNTVKYFVNFDEKVSIVSGGTATINLNGKEFATSSQTEAVTNGGKTSVVYTFTLPASNESGTLSLSSVLGLQVKDEAGNQFTYTGSPTNAGTLTFYGTMAVQSILTNLQMQGASTAQYGTDYTATLRAVAGYTLPATLNVKIGGVVISTGYNYNSSTGAFTIEGNKITGTIEITASGTPINSAVSFDAQGGLGGTQQATATYNATMPTITALPTRTGYTFAGYFASPNGQGKKYYDEQGNIVINCDFYTPTTLYAFWKANEYTIIYNENKPSGASGTVSSSK